jgi:protoporphyrinogen oxidase
MTPQLTILGGGPAGLGVAFYAQKAGIRFELFERDSTLGGMCRTLREGDHSYDLGAHRFHDRDSEITRDLTGLMGEELIPVSAPSVIWDRGRFIDFPPTPLNVISSCGIGEFGRIAWELMSARIRPRTVNNFEDFAVSQFGATLARRILLNYSEKLWGLPAAELSADIATHRLQGMTLRSLLLELLSPKRKTTHIDGSFVYPRGGYGRIAEAIERELPPAAVHTKCEITMLECRRGIVTRIGFADGSSLAPRGRIISTLPLGLLVRQLREQVADDARRAAVSLRFRHIRLIFVRLNRPSVSTNASIYVPDKQFCISRIYEPKNRSAAMAPAHETSLVAEAPCFPGDDIHRFRDEELAERIISELTHLSLVKREDILGWKHHHIPNAYPVYTIGYSNSVQTILDALHPIVNLDTIGRAGLFFYSHLHDQLRFGKDYVQALMQTDEAATSLSASAY